MNSLTDYYAVLGVRRDAPASAIKAAFKKLALQYHPDVYKGEDAQERMRILLLAYQTLSDPVARKAYDARRSEHFLDTPARPGTISPSTSRGHQSEVSPSARRDRHRHYDFPDLDDGVTVQVNLGDMVYDLSLQEARALKQQGLLRGIAPEASGKVSPEALERYPHHCHRCHHRWIPALETRKPGSREARRIQFREPICPACKADDWGEYLILRCVHCRAVFESEQIRYAVSSYHYGDRSLCPPYELFPLCPYCGASGWCPAEDVRVSTLRAKAKQRAIMLGLMWFSIIVIALLLLGVIVITMLKP
jgi:hypothetical protein